MNPKFAQINPMRLPHWRYERVVELLRCRPRPGRVTREDDHPIRRAHRMFSELAVAGSNQARIGEIRNEHADFWRAHEIHYSTDSLTRHMLEAHLLVQDLSFEEIAPRFDTTRETVEYFAQVYYDVRDRLKSSMWIQKIIRGDYDPFCRPAKGGGGELSRGYVLRTLAYSGGRHILEAAIQGLTGNRKPESGAEILHWLGATLEQSVRSAAVAAGLTLQVDSKNAMQLMRIAVKSLPPGRGRSRLAGLRERELDARMFTVLSDIQAAANPRKSGRTGREFGPVP